MRIFATNKITFCMKKNIFLPIFMPLFFFTTMFGQKSKPNNIITVTANGVSFEMVFVEGGSFVMGCTSEQESDCESDEKPTHRVNLPNFYIGKFEVTQRLWNAVMGKNPSNWKGDSLPVENVNWNDCQTFVGRLNKLTGRQFCLPSEAQWEYAARGGNKGNGHKYSGSDSIQDVIWCIHNSGGKTYKVGDKLPNELGLYDMSGNVWEWCEDRYADDYYSHSLTDSPTGATSGSKRVLRGGSWRSYPQRCRVSYRQYEAPDFRDNVNGMRLVLIP
jgi:formylglycine-generating enzyme required for sulfatase activity